MYKINKSKEIKNLIISVIFFLTGLLLGYNVLKKGTNEIKDIVSSGLLIILSFPIIIDKLTRIIKLKKLEKIGIVYRNIPYEYVKINNYNEVRYKKVCIPTNTNSSEIILYGPKEDKKDINCVTGTTNAIIDPKNNKNYYIGDIKERVD